MDDERDLDAFLAKEQNALDHLTQKIYGPLAKFESISPFGQQTIEKLARDRAIVSEPDPELRQAKVEAIELRRENTMLSDQLVAALREVQDLSTENEELKLELYDVEEREDRLTRSAKQREKRLRREFDDERRRSGF